MLKKRLIGVVTVRNNWAVQSFHYSRYLPLGKPQCLVENLDRWGADEIFVQEIDRSAANAGPNIELIKTLASRHLSTPIIYAGGIRTKADAINTVRAGAERICVDSLLYENPEEIKKIASALGAQAVVASIPLVKAPSTDNVNDIFCYNYQSKTLQPISSPVLDLIESGIISELVLIDKEHEGQKEGFDFSLIKAFTQLPTSLILFGGLSNQEVLTQALAIENVSAVAIGNFLNYKEHSIQAYKEHLHPFSIRPPVYDSIGL